MVKSVEVCLFFVFFRFGNLICFKQTDCVASWWATSSRWLWFKSFFVLLFKQWYQVVLLIPPPPLIDEHIRHFWCLGASVEPKRAYWCHIAVSRWVGSWCQGESCVMAGIYADKALTFWWFVTGFQVGCVYSYFNFMIRLQNVIMFSSSKTFGEYESRALESRSGPYLRCAHRALGKRSEAVTVERLLFHMTDFSNCSKINLWQEREAAAAAGWEDWLS